MVTWPWKPSPALGSSPGGGSSGSTALVRVKGGSARLVAESDTWDGSFITQVIDGFFTPVRSRLLSHLLRGDSKTPS